MKKYIFIFLLFVLIIVSQIISVHNRYVKKQEILNNKRDVDRLIEIGFDDEAERLIDKFKTTGDEEILIRIAIAKGNLYKALEIADENNIFDKYPEYILNLSEAFYNKGQFSKAYKIIIKNHSKANDEELSKKIDSLLIKIISEVRITEVDFEISGDWSFIGESMVVAYNSGKYIINENGNIYSNKYDEIFEEDDKYIVSSNGIKFVLKPDGKFDSFLDEESAELKETAELKESEKDDNGNKTMKPEGTIPEMEGIIVKTENSGLFGYSYKDYEIIKPEYTAATNINKKGIGFIKAEDKWYKIQFMAFSDY